MAKQTEHETGRLTADIDLKLVRGVKAKAAELGKTKNELVEMGMSRFLKQLEDEKLTA